MSATSPIAPFPAAASLPDAPEADEELEADCFEMGGPDNSADAYEYTAAEDLPAADASAAVRAREKRAALFAEDLSRVVRTQLSAIPEDEPALKLEVLRRALIFFASRPTDSPEFSPAASIVSLDTIVDAADRLTRKLTDLPEYNLALRLISGAFTMSDALEQRLLMNDSIPQTTAMQMAGIHSARARKVTYAEAQRGLAEGSISGETCLAMALLQIHNTATRYERLIGSVDIAGFHLEGMHGCIEDIRLAQGLAEDTIGWALDRIDRLIGSGAKKLAAAQQRPPDMIMISQRFMNTMDDVTAGLYVFSPGILKRCADALTALELHALAKIFTRRAAHHLVLARRLGIQP